MSNDLISRKALLEELREILNEPHNTIFLMGIGDAISIIEHRETAFDKEKVIANLREELKLAEIEKERCITESPSQFQSAKGYANGVSFGLEIVEKGGIE